MKLLVTKLYVIFLLIVSVSLFLTMFYMDIVHHTNAIISDNVEIFVRNCSCKNAEISTTDTPAYNYTSHTNSTNETLTWKLNWPQRDGLKLCKNPAKKLIGRINFTPSLTVDDIRNANVISKVKYGGVYRPTHCKSPEKVAVIIPYRDRANQLDILVHHLHNMLQRQQLYYGIYVVEMALPVQFNRGLLANAGFQTARSIGNYTCYIIHDVDLIPINDYNLYKCSNKGPTHLVAHSSGFEKGKLPYEGYVGGVIALSTEQYNRINGFSNLYFGWGGEDDDLFSRFISFNMTLQRSPEHIGIYVALPHSDDSSNPPNPHREMLLSQASYRIDIDGLSSANYNRKALEFRELFTWILIDCSESEVLKRYPYLKTDPEFMARKVKKDKYLTVIKSRNGVIREHKFVYKGRDIFPKKQLKQTTARVKE